MSSAVKLDPQTKTRLKSLGGKIDRTPHWIMKEAIEQYLDEQERYWKEREEDMARWEHYSLTGEFVPHESVATWLESVGTQDETSCPK